MLLETAGETRLTYIPLKGGGDVARSLAERQVDITVNNPIEAEKLWPEGKVRPLCVFDGKRLDYRAKIAGNQTWNDLPTCMSFGIPVQYLMMRGIFMAPGVTRSRWPTTSNCWTRCAHCRSGRSFMAQGAFNQTVMTGEPFVDWLERARELSPRPDARSQADLCRGAAASAVGTKRVPARPRKSSNPAIERRR